MGRTRGHVSRQCTHRHSPEGISPLEIHQSPPLADIVRDINKFSNNTAARQLYLALGLTNSSNRRRVRGVQVLPRRVLWRARGDGQHTNSAINRMVSNSDNGRATLEKSDMAMRRWLASRRCSFPELVIENGSGLSRAERISAGHLGALIALGFPEPGHAGVHFIPADCGGGRHHEETTQRQRCRWSGAYQDRFAGGRENHGWICSR